MEWNLVWHIHNHNLFLLTIKVNIIVYLRITRQLNSETQSFYGFLAITIFNQLHHNLYSV